MVQIDNVSQFVSASTPQTYAMQHSCHRVTMQKALDTRTEGRLESQVRELDRGVGTPLRVLFDVDA